MRTSTLPRAPVHHGAGLESGVACLPASLPCSADTRDGRRPRPPVPVPAGEEEGAAACSELLAT